MVEASTCCPLPSIRSRLLLLTVRRSLRASNMSAASAASAGSIDSSFPAELQNTDSPSLIPASLQSECACHRTSASGHPHTCCCRRKLDRGKIEESCRRNCICAAMQGRVQIELQAKSDRERLALLICRESRSAFIK